jgi:serine/threonine protein kinase
MASNYASDPNNISSVGHSATPQSGFNGSVSSSSHTPDGSAGRGGKVRLSTGTILSGARYRIEKSIAEGGMGAVYRAMDTRFNRPCAVKEMLDNFHTEAERAQSLEWFEREAELLLELNHPCIPRVRDFFAENGKHYLVMDLIDGRTLAQVVESEGQVQGVSGARGVTEARARSWGQQICNVLGYLHRQTPPIIFRDLKPSNIMVTEREEIKLIDFGIARTIQSTQVQSTIIMTIGYAPPEQMGGRAEPRSDIYALGATLHKVLTRHDAANNQPDIFSFPPVRALRPDITPAFEQVLIRALASKLDQRWSNASEMERALMNLPPVTALPPVGPAGQQGQRPAVYPPTPSAGTPGLVGSSMPGTVASGAGGTSAATSSTTGPAGMHINAAQGHLSSMPPRVDAAYEAVKLAHGLEPNNALVHKLFGQIFARRVPPQADLALRAYSRSLQINPDDPETHKLVGDVSLFLRQQPLQGIPAYIQSQRLNPNDYETRWRLGQCYEKTNQLEAALREYQEAARLAPKQPPIPALHFALGQLALRLNQFPVAEQAFVQVLFINPGDHQTRFLLSQVYENEGKFEEALRECTYVLQGPLSANPAVQQMHQRLRARLGR